MYVPHEIANLVSNSEFHHDGRDRAVDSSSHRSAWLVFVANEHVLGQVREASALQGRRFRVVGHPKVDALRRVFPDVKDDMLRWARSRVTPEEYRAWLDAWCSLPNVSTFDGLHS